MTTGHTEAEPFWVEFLRSLARRGLRGVKLVISDAHEGLKATIIKVLSAIWQRCRVHLMRNALSYAGKTEKDTQRTIEAHILPSLGNLLLSDLTGKSPSPSHGENRNLSETQAPC